MIRAYAVSRSPWYWSPCCCEGSLPVQVGRLWPLVTATTDPRRIRNGVVRPGDVGTALCGKLGG